MVENSEGLGMPEDFSILANSAPPMDAVSNDLMMTAEELRIAALEELPRVKEMFPNFYKLFRMMTEFGQELKQFQDYAESGNNEL